jgi:alpha-ketoglutarate-dependent taurine dioxygenase
MGESSNLGQGVMRARTFRRQSVRVSKGEMVRIEPPPTGGSLPLLLTPAIADLNLSSWAEANRQSIDSLINQHGALLFRGFGLKSAEDLAQFVKASSGEPPLEYQERSSPRSTVSGNIYTSTDYPADQSIVLHNENSYRLTFPTRIYFHCVIPARSGGETPLANSRGVLRRIPAPIRERFMEKQVLYVRNYGDGFGVSWQTAYQTEDKAEVEKICRRDEIDFEWKSGDRLRTRSVRPAIIKHPRTGEVSWFNHAVFFNVTSLESSMCTVLLSELGEENLPTNTYYGDGSRIEADELTDLRAAYDAETVRFPWQSCDVLMVDNILTSHGRGPYEGDRRVLVGMSCPTHW